MIKINYPEDSLERISFEKRYYGVLTKNWVDKIDGHLKQWNIEGKELTYKILVTLGFEKLMEFGPEIKAYADKLDKDTGEKTKRGIPIMKNEFKDLFRYDSNQSALASFFMKEFSDLKCCHYCGIDFINAFTDISDYTTKIQFINRAFKYELELVEGIDSFTAQEIIDARQKKEIKKISQIKLDSNIVANIDAFDFKRNYNHFTLDHIFPQSKYPFYSLCLYNFVPSCYSCNSKFKSNIEFEIEDELLQVSPSSSTYSLTDHFDFSLLGTDDLTKISSVNDLSLEITIKGYKSQIEHYLKMFKIPGRYKFHKNYAVELIKRKVKYPDSQISKLSKKTGMSQLELRKRIFGQELFDNSIKNEPLIKFKRDIAIDIGIKDVVTSI